MKRIPEPIVQNITRWWFQIFFMFTPIWGRFPFWLIFFRWVETTNQIICGLIEFIWAIYSFELMVGGFN